MDTIAAMTTNPVTSRHVRAQGQRFQIAQRLHRGERLFEG